MLPEISAAAQVGFPLVSAIVFLPALAALAIMFVRSSTALTIALGAVVLELILVAWAWTVHDPSIPAMQLAENGRFLGLGYHLAIDGVSVLFLAATALLTLFAVMYATKSVDKNLNNYLAALLFSQAALMGAFSAVNLFLFWLFFVAEIIPSYRLIKGWGTGQRRDTAAQSYAMYMALSALVIAIGFITLGGSVTTGFSFDLAVITEAGVSTEAQNLIFLLLCVGFAIKAPLFPFHAWLPKVLEHGPLIGMSVFLVGIKLGAYGFMRFVVPILPEATAEFYWLLAGFGFASMVYGALIALVQTNLRRLMAFASVSHMGVITLGMFSMNVAGMEGAVLQALNLGITGAGLFLIASFLSARIGSPDLSSMGGLHGKAPLMALGFLVIALAAIGMPGTSGFNGEHMVLLGAFERHWVMAVLVGVGPILTAAYFLRFYQRAFLGDASETAQGEVSDLQGSERLIVAAVVGVVLWIGLFTTPFIGTMGPSVKTMVAEYSALEKDTAHADASESEAETETLLVASQSGSADQ